MNKEKIIWVKEYKDIVSILRIKKLLKNSIKVKRYTNKERVLSNDVIICSNQDNNNNVLDKNILFYENISQEIDEILTQYYLSNYNLCYLESAIRFTKNNYINSIFTGSSYALFGIIENEDSNYINCSLSSQDLYYSSLIIKRVCEINQSIENVIIIWPYYYFYTDLSKTKNPSEVARISDIYYPLFNDMHNAKWITRKNSYCLDSELFNLDNLFRQYSDYKYNRNYFTAPFDRELIAIHKDEDDHRLWSELSFEEREQIAFKRAMAHNKTINNLHTFEENIEIFLNLLAYLDERKIKIHIVIPPFTEHYRKYFNNEFKNISYEIWNLIEYQINIIDLYDSIEFSDSDFVDAEHLNEKGAKKFTNILKRKILKNVI